MTTVVVALAVLLAACADHGMRPLATAASINSDQYPTQSTSSDALGDVEVHLHGLVRDAAIAAVPSGPWTEHLPDGSDTLGGATDTCVDGQGRDTGYKLVPFTMTAPYDTAASEVENGALLQRAQSYFEAQGFHASISTPIGSAGRVAGWRDGYLISVELPKNAKQIVAEGTAPCAR